MDVIISFIRPGLPNLLEFDGHLLTKLNKSSLISKTNPTINLELYFFGDHMMDARGAFVVIGVEVGNHWIGPTHPQMTLRNVFEQGSIELNFLLLKVGENFFWGFYLCFNF